MFTQAGGYFAGTSVKEIIDRGIPSWKIVLGKPASPGDAYNTGYVDAVQLGGWIDKAFS